MTHHAGGVILYNVTAEADRECRAERHRRRRRPLPPQPNGILRRQLLRWDERLPLGRVLVLVPGARAPFGEAAAGLSDPFTDDRPLRGFAQPVEEEAQGADHLI